MTLSYAAQKNAVYNNAGNSIVTAADRWTRTYNNLATHSQLYAKRACEGALAMFKQRYPKIKVWQDLPLAEAKSAKLNQIFIDETMQRELDIEWVISIISKFMSTKVVPIQVYRDADDPNKLIAWDGQHTLMALWIIANFIGADCNAIEVPVNIFQSSLKSEMRENFISLNSSDGKKELDHIDLWRQRIYGVRIDNSKRPDWIATNQKQIYLENAGLFVTATKFGDEDMVGAITHVQELDKLSVDEVRWLSRYLEIVINASYDSDGNVLTGRPIGTKEMTMMGHYFSRCSANGIKVTDEYVVALAHVNLSLFSADFTPTSDFWVKNRISYENWHARTGQTTGVRLLKNWAEGFPFLVAQLNKSFAPLGFEVPQNDSNRGYCPIASDLY